ncbi:GPP34 family phosphoprotein [Dactylosporangium sp. NPDC051485]|uniref:GOLPH3/VPS74 family protein n=1 Tax=Dactylosporangium sp. NPDC051485 TaxID=3154846 RepID=UPI0034333988
MTHAYRPPAALAATDFWMLAHHERSGQLLVPGRVVAVGLAAALLAELLVEDRIGFDQQHMVVPVSEYPPRDAVAHQVLDQLHGEDRLPVQVWLRHLAQTAYEGVAARMLRRRLVERVEDRRLLGRSRVTYRPVDPNASGWPAARLHIFLLEQRVFADADVILAGLAKVTGLHVRALEGGGHLAERYLDAQIAGARPLYRELFAHTAAVVGSTVMSGR